MQLKELNHRSPIRVFERSVHGGLGRGNLGVVAARTGVGKSAFLTCLGIDDLLRGRKVLHVTTTATVDHVSEYYEEIFSDLARASNLEESVLVRDQIEHARIIQRLIGNQAFVGSLVHAVSLLRTHVDFHPDLVIIEGFDLERASAEDVSRLKSLARELNAEMWMSHRVPRPQPGHDWHEVPAAIARLGDLVSVVVLLQAVQDAIRIRLLKDHDSRELADLTLDLDPNTLLVKER
jgi:hypothetical protein